MTPQRGPQLSFKNVWFYKANLEGPLFYFLWAPSNLWLGSRSRLPQGDLSPLWHEFKAKNAHQEPSNVGILMCDSIVSIYIISNPILWIKSELKHHKINTNKIYSFRSTQD